MRAVLKALSLLALLGLASCGDSPTKPETIFGLYQLETVGGTPMPFVLFEDEEGRLEIVSGSMLLQETYRFKLDWTVRLTLNGQSDTDHDIDTGTFEQNGTAMTLTFSDGRTFPATLIDKTLTVTDASTTFVYVKY